MKQAAQCRCTHCTLPVPRGLIVPDREEQFCCSACEAVYGAIHGCGLEQYYALRDSAGAEAVPAQRSGGAKGEYDDEAFERLYVSKTLEGVCTTELLLENVHCAACVWLLERLPSVVPGVLESRLDFGRSTLRLVWRGDQVNLSRIARAVESFGYPTHPAKGVDAGERRRIEDRRMLTNIAIAGACAGNVMLLSVALYGGWVEGVEDGYRRAFRWLAAVITAISLAWPARTFYRGAWAALRARTWHLDMPVALALLVGGAAGIVNAVAGRGEIYFDSLTMLVFLLLVGRFLQSRQQRRAADAVELLYSLTPSRARLVQKDGSVRDAAIEAVNPGDLVEVRPGDSAPVDGVVESVIGAETGSVDASVLTGESVPAAVGPGQRVAAGSVCVSATLRVRAEAVGAETRVGAMMRTLERLAESRVPVIGAGDRIAGWFVGAVIVLSIATVALWWSTGPFTAFEHAVALLIACCPCAVALATPLAASMAVGRAAGRGILIKGGDVLERLSRPGVVVLDKTGTITEGAFGVAAIVGDRESLAYAAALEADSTHPIGRAMVGSQARLAGEQSYRASSVTHEPGAGVSGWIGGERTAVGSAKFLIGLGVRVGGQLSAALDAAASKGRTPVLVARGEDAIGLIELGDAPRPGSADAVAALRSAGWRVRLLSGDHPEAVRSCGRALGLDEADCEGGLTPEAKLERIAELARAETGPVVMVGDGVNDAPALARADVGVAVSGGAEASLAASDVYLRRPGLDGLPLLIVGSRRACRLIYRAIAVSVCYNAGAAALAMAGLLSPLAAAVIMPASSITVLTIAITGRSFQKRGRGDTASPAPAKLKEAVA